MDMRSAFIQWYFNEFHEDKLYTDMAAVSEDSPWHRERNVAIHTDMVVAQYLSSTPPTWTKPDLFGALTCVFHDVGKPVSRQEKYKPERGTYYGYSGHELASARLWEDYVVRNWSHMVEVFGLIPPDIYYVGWLVENHRPWGITKLQKLDMLARTVKSIATPDTFAAVLYADNWGRIGDNHEENQAKSAEWITSFLRRCEDLSPADVPNELPVMIMPIAASGSGKSTLQQTNAFPFDMEHYSLDLLRTKWYGDDYNVAFKRSCEDKKFISNAQREFINLLKDGKNIFVDNTNTSAKRRKFYINEARRRGYRVVAVLLPVDLQTIISRQQTRHDKEVPAEAVRRQYMNLSYPNVGDFDDIVVSGDNL